MYACVVKMPSEKHTVIGLYGWMDLFLFIEKIKIKIKMILLEFHV